MIAMIERLIAKGHAYAAEGHVLFSVPSMSDYGRLSRHTRDELVAGARVDVAPYKKDPADFVLWKPSTPQQPGWDSPWGRGRPGWHIECSAMSGKHLGETFDIHAGGLDLIFPHHENEIAQSRSAFGHAIMAKYWMHNGFLNISGEKMSKSLGNFFTVHELLDQYPGRGDPPAAAVGALPPAARLHARGSDPGQGDARPLVRRAARQGRACRPMRCRSRSRMRCRTTSTRRSPSAPSISSAIPPSCAPARTRSGLLQQDAEAWFRWTPAGSSGPTDAEIEAAIAARQAARKAKDFKESDRIRDELKAKGVILEDGPKGTTWKRG